MPLPALPQAALPQRRRQIHLRRLPGLAAAACWLAGMARPRSLRQQASSPPARSVPSTPLASAPHAHDSWATRPCRTPCTPLYLSLRSDWNLPPLARTQPGPMPFHTRNRFVGPQPVCPPPHPACSCCRSPVSLSFPAELCLPCIDTLPPCLSQAPLSASRQPRSLCCVACAATVFNSPPCFLPCL